MPFLIRNKTFSLFNTLLLLIVFSVSSCNITKMPKPTTKSISIPSDFGEDETTLLIVKTKNWIFNKQTKNKAISEYNGNYEIIKEEDLLSSEYQDTSKYRYVLKFRIRSIIRGSYGGGSYSRMDYATPLIIDRKNDKKYLGSESDRFKSLVHICMQELEKQRLKNK